MPMPNLASLMQRSLDDKILADVPVNSGKTIPTGTYTGVGREIREGYADTRDPNRAQLRAEFELPDEVYVYGDMSMDAPAKPNSKGKHIDFKLILYLNLVDALKMRKKTFAEVYEAFKGVSFNLVVEETASCLLSDIPKEHPLYKAFVNESKKPSDKVYPVIEAKDHKLRTHLAGKSDVYVNNRIKRITLA